MLPFANSSLREHGASLCCLLGRNGCLPNAGLEGSAPQMPMMLTRRVEDFRITLGRSRLKLHTAALKQDLKLTVLRCLSAHCLPSICEAFADSCLCSSLLQAGLAGEVVKLALLSFLISLVLHACGSHRVA